MTPESIGQSNPNGEPNINQVSEDVLRNLAEEGGAITFDDEELENTSLGDLEKDLESSSNTESMEDFPITDEEAETVGTGQTAENSVETEATPKPIEARVLESFRNDLNISAEGLESMEGFNELSQGQQLMVLENLKQLAVGRIHEEAADAHEEAYSRSQAQAGFFGKIGRAFKENLGGKQIDTARREKQVAGEILTGGIDQHRDTMQELVAGMAERGPEVTQNPETGALEVAYAASIEGATPEEQKTLDYFNGVANELGSIPYEWTLDTATKEQKDKVQEITDRFEEVKQRLFSVKEKHSESPREVHEYVARAEYNTKMNQFMNTNPDVEEELMQLRDKNTLKYVLKQSMGKIAEKGAYFGAGYAARSVLIGAAGAVAAPVVGMAMGGMMGRKRANERIHEMELEARKGKRAENKAEKAAERNFVQATGENGLQSKLTNLLDKLEKYEETEEERNQEIADEDKMPHGLHGGSVSGREKLLESLSARIKYTEDKIGDGLVDFGKSDVRLHGQYELTNALIRAKAMKDMLSEKSRTTERLDAVLGIRKEKIDTAQKMYVRRKMISGATFGGAIAGAGALAAEYMNSGQSFQNNAPEAVVDTFNSISGYANDTIEMISQMGTAGAEEIQDTFAEASESGALGRDWQEWRDAAMADMNNLSAKDGVAFESGSAVVNEGNSGSVGDNLEELHETLEGVGGSDESLMTHELPEDIPVQEVIRMDPVSVEASSRGAIQTFVDLKEQMRVEYPDPSSRPPVIQKLLEKDAIDLARDYGFYKPEDIEESSLILKGDQIRVSENGTLEYVKNNGQIITLEDGVDFNSAEGNFGDKGGKMFDYSPSENIRTGEGFGSGGHSETGPVITEYGTPDPFNTPDHTITVEDVELNASEAFKAANHEMINDLKALYGERYPTGGLDFKDPAWNTFREVDAKTFMREYYNPSSSDIFEKGDTSRFNISQEISKLKGLINAEMAQVHGEAFTPQTGESVEEFIQRIYLSQQIGAPVGELPPQVQAAYDAAAPKMQEHLAEQNSILSEDSFFSEANAREVLAADVGKIHGTVRLDDAHAQGWKESAEFVTREQSRLSDLMERSGTTPNPNETVEQYVQRAEASLAHGAPIDNQMTLDQYETAEIATSQMNEIMPGRIFGKESFDEGSLLTHWMSLKDVEIGEFNAFRAEHVVAGENGYAFTSEYEDDTFNVPRDDRPMRSGLDSAQAVGKMNEFIQNFAQTSGVKPLPSETISEYIARVTAQAPGLSGS